ncbi:MAG: alpha/beta hydrolase [Clostridiales bacterium]|nr:alpha/beta hydrolase [Bacillota bacterium]NLL54478.1 alpha/beta hydrolase [Clostridiales bacterium]
MRRKTVCDPNGKIVYWVSEAMDAERDTLFFLHGLTADHTMFEEQVVCFGRDYNVIVWDAPAHGQSRPYNTFTFGNATSGMKRIIDECGLSQVILIGQSMGGYLSQSFALGYPEQVKALVSIGSTPYGEYYSKSDIWWLNQIGWIAKLLPEKLLKQTMVKHHAMTKNGRENMAAMVAQYEKTELCWLMRTGYKGFLEDNRTFDICCPVLLLVGEKDRTGKVKSYNKEWAKRTGYELIWIPGAAHNAHVDNPAAVNNSIRHFLESLK